MEEAVTPGAIPFTRIPFLINLQDNPSIRLLIVFLVRPYGKKSHWLPLSDVINIIIDSDTSLLFNILFIKFWVIKYAPLKFILNWLSNPSSVTSKKSLSCIDIPALFIKISKLLYLS